jgi:hypothetical protein
MSPKPTVLEMAQGPEVAEHPKLYAGLVVHAQQVADGLRRAEWFHGLGCDAGVRFG